MAEWLGTKAAGADLASGPACVTLTGLIPICKTEIIVSGFHVTTFHYERGSQGDQDKFQKAENLRVSGTSTPGRTQPFKTPLNKGHLDP